MVSSFRAVAEVVPERIRRVVWLAGAVTLDGQTLIDAIPQSPWIARAVTIARDGTVHTDPDLILDANIHDGTESERAFVRARHLPYPPHALIELGRLSAFLALGLPTGYITALEDRTIEPHLCGHLAGRLPGCLRLEVPGGHDCMITRPDAVAAALITMAEAEPERA